MPRAGGFDVWPSPGPRVPILYLSRDGILDGLGESQIVSYLVPLADRHRFWLVTFEKSLDGVEEARRRLAAAGIEWVALSFHGRESPVRAGLDLLTFALRAFWLVISRRIRILHARSYLPCAVALAVRAICVGYPRVVFDMRGFWVDERAEAGHWDRGRARYRYGKRLERVLLRAAAEVITLTRAAQDEAARLRGDGPAGGPITVIPTCVDTRRFVPAAHGAVSEHVRAAWRDRLIFIYVGAAGFWQDPEALVRFFGTVAEQRADAAFLCLLRTGAADMRRVLVAAGLAPVSRVEEAVPSSDLPGWLAAASVGVVWYRPTFSRIGNFPTKLGEYLACGLPVIVAGATADSVELVWRERVGAVIQDFSPAAYRDAVAEAVALLKDPDTPARCRRTAERHLSLAVGEERYAAIYRRLSGGVA